ncbi:MAG: addiction module antitoxin [Anaerolinea sp.]|nr:addiction module antitoxin [Anaerolinea sp.]
MHRKLTITIDEQVYAGLHRRVGQGHISQFIESLVRPHVMDDDLVRDYEELAADEEGEREALEWAEALIADIADEPR